MTTYSNEKLEEIGFREVARWRLDGDRLAYDLVEDAPELEAICRFPNVLYAFTSGDAVLYVGKTTKSVRLRFIGYCNPGPSQVTNQKCHAEIKALLKRNCAVSISVFSGDRFLRYDVFEINLAAGLEDSLIRVLRPRWNGKFVTGAFVSETAEIEAQSTIPATPSSSPHRVSTTYAKFRVTLGKTYYRTGFINTGKAVSAALGPDGAPMLIHLVDASHAGVKTKIDRRANANGTPRIYGGAETSEWFQEHFSQGDVVTGQVLTPNEILLETPQPSAAVAQR